MREYDTYIFDLDGTLLNTLGDLAASVNYALHRYSMPEHTLEDIRWFVGNGVKKLMERSVPDGMANPRFEEVFKTFREHYMEHSLDTTKPYPGIPDMLNGLKCRGKKIAVVSNKFYTATQELCRHFRRLCGCGNRRTRKHKAQTGTRYSYRGYASAWRVFRQCSIYRRQRRGRCNGCK